MTSLHSVNRTHNTTPPPIHLQVPACQPSSKLLGGLPGFLQSKQAKTRTQETTTISNNPSTQHHLPPSSTTSTDTPCRSRLSLQHMHRCKTHKQVLNVPSQQVGMQPPTHPTSHPALTTQNNTHSNYNPGNNAHTHYLPGNPRPYH